MAPSGPVVTYGPVVVGRAVPAPLSGAITNAQSWTAGSDTTPKALGKCLDVTGAGTANGTRLRIRTCGTGAGQRWALPG
jgi:hypothetical protein